MTDVLVIGAGPAGVLAALRAADLGAQTALVTSGTFGGMAANDGPVPVRTLAHAGRLMREARQLGQYGVKVSEPVLDYSRFGMARMFGFREIEPIMKAITDALRLSMPEIELTPDRPIEVQSLSLSTNGRGSGLSSENESDLAPMISSI
jgi:hypothetical protein